MSDGNERDGAMPLAGKRVFVVEDETLVAMLLEDIVRDLGGTVVASAARVGRALDAVTAHAGEIDLAILDVNLCGEEVFPVATTLKERTVPFAFSTGYGNSGLPAAWKGYPTLQKPFTHDQVRAVLSQALGQARG